MQLIRSAPLFTLFCFLTACTTISPESTDAEHAANENIATQTNATIDHTEETAFKKSETTDTTAQNTETKTAEQSNDIDDFSQTISSSLNDERSILNINDEIHQQDIPVQDEDSGASQKAPPSANQPQANEAQSPVNTHPIIWTRLRDGFQLDLTQENQRIKLQRDWYAKNQNYLDRTFNRAAPYLYHIVEEVDKRGLPMELALLPVVESAFDPFAYSHGRASGMWQFIPSTGRIYGLKQDWWYDGRRDIVASTDGALKYLSWLAGRFNGNWEHALASYNSGSGTVSNAIKRNTKRGRQTDFWSLKLPRETRAYVPKLIAISQLVANPSKYGITLPDIEDKPYFEVVDTGSQLDLSQAASMAGIDLDLLYKLNPGFNRWATSPMGPHKLVIPLENAETFRQKLQSLPKNQRVNWSRYTIQKGDSLIRIAKKHHTTPSVIKEVNNMRGNTIRAGKTLLIPVAKKQLDQYVLSSSSRLKKTQNQYSGASSATKIEYKVKRGDTFWDISRKYNVGVRQLAKWNGMAPKDPLKPGQTLIIWSKNSKSSILAATKPPGDRAMIRKINYRVRNGDSLARIANKFNVSIKDIVSWNGINPKSYLQPGQRLTLHVNIAAGY